MTKVYYEERGKRHRLFVQGHATGSEAACAGISAILYALEGYLALNETARLREVRMKSAEVVLDYEGGEDVETAYEMAVVGLVRLSTAYPEQIRVEVADD